MQFNGISRARVSSILLFLPLIFITATYGKNTSEVYTAIVPLNRTLSWGNKELYEGVMTLNAYATLVMELTDPDKSLSFIIFQVHSYLYDIALYNNTYTPESVVVGTDVGLYSPVKPVLDTFFIYNLNEVDVFIYIKIHGYGAADPIPGGCNMEFPTAISPYILTTINDDYITVDLAAARDIKDPDCKYPDDVTVVFYQKYISHKYTSDIDVYIDGMENMSSLYRIRHFGEEIEDNGDRMRRRVATYRGVGVVYVAIAYSKTDSSAYSVYVPRVVFSCNPLKEGDCDRIDGFLPTLMCILLYMVGLFLCYFGHYFFKVEMFLMGTLSGVVLTYIVISLIAAVEQTALIVASVLSGVGFGAIWLLFWWFYGIPMLSVFLPGLNVGFLLSACCYYVGPSGLGYLQLDLYFWTLNILLIFFAAATVVSAAYISNMLCCAIIGAYSLVFAMGYFVNSNLSYIVINLVRRAVVPKFNKVLLMPPYGTQEVLELVLFSILVVTGFLTQYFTNRGRPPFPPPPRSVRPTVPESYGTIDQDRRYDDEENTPRNPSTENHENAPLLA